MWKNRARLPYSFEYNRDIVDEEDPVVSLVLLFMHRESFALLTYTLYSLSLTVCDRAKPAVIPEIVLQLVLHVWLTVPYRPNMMDNAFEYHAQLVSSTAPLNFSSAEYIQTTVIDGVGADAFMLRLVEDLERPGVSDRYVAALLEALRVMGMTKLLRPYFIKHKCVDAIARAIESRCVPQNGDRFRAKLYQNALVLMQ